jgi:hypothetical protein
MRCKPFDEQTREAFPRGDDGGELAMWDSHDNAPREIASGECLVHLVSSRIAHAQ